MLKPVEQTCLIALRFGEIFFSSDQVCTAGSRLVDANTFDHVVADVAGDTERLKIRPALDPDTQLRLLVSGVQRAWVSPYLQPAHRGGVDAAIPAANDNPYGLHVWVRTRNLRPAHQLAARLQSGNVCINTHNLSDPAFPMDGYRQSGRRRASGFAAIEHYTELQAVGARL